MQSGILMGRLQRAQARQAELLCDLADALGLQSEWQVVEAAGRRNLAKGIDDQHAALYGQEATVQFLETVLSRLQEKGAHHARRTRTPA
jgi:ribosomal protein S6